MICSKCGKTLDTQRTGFIVCEHCKEVHHRPESHSSQVKQHQLKKRRRHNLFIAGGVTLILFGMTYTGYALIKTPTAEKISQQVAVKEEEKETTPNQAKETKKPDSKTPTNTPKAPASEPIPKRYGSTAAAAQLANATTLAQAQSALAAFFSQYGLTAQVISTTPSSYVQGFSTHSLLNSGNLYQLKAYGKVFIDEWAKYPADWVKNSKLQKVAFVKKLTNQGIYVAALPDPIGDTLYYDVTYGTGDYARNVVHHEYGHLIEYNYFNLYNRADSQWTSCHPASFSYGSGGITSYGQPGFVNTEHPSSGFVTAYAKYGIEEDKAEVYAYLMVTEDYLQLKQWIKTDSCLAKKVSQYKEFIGSHSAVMKGVYYDAIN